MASCWASVISDHSSQAISSSVSATDDFLSRRDLDQGLDRAADRRPGPGPAQRSSHGLRDKAGQLADRDRLNLARLVSRDLARPLAGRKGDGEEHAVIAHLDPAAAE